MLWIYWLEKHPAYFSKVDHLWQACRKQQHEVSSSILTIGEVLVMPARHQLLQSQSMVEAFFASGAVRVLPIEPPAMRIFAQLRASTRVPPADALHLACAAAHGVDYFLTNDKSLRPLKIPGIQTIAALDVNLT
jgi:predicted nucleic acid-binding protein